MIYLFCKIPEFEEERDIGMGLIVAAVILIVIISYFIASEMQDIAVRKGYESKCYFWFSFLFGLPGWIMVAALPNQNIQYLLTEMNKSMKQDQNNKKAPFVTASEQRPVQSTETEKTESASLDRNTSALVVPAGKEMIRCTGCGHVQKNNRTVCWECGAKLIKSDE